MSLRWTRTERNAGKISADGPTRTELEVACFVTAMPTELGGWPAIRDFTCGSRS